MQRTDVEVVRASITDAERFAATWLKVLDKRQRLTPLRYNRAQRHYLANRTSRDLILKARQLGFSTLIQAELYRYNVTGTARTLTLSHKDDSTQALRRIAALFWREMPGALRPARHHANATLTSYPGFNSEAITATAGGQGVGRSLTTSHQHWSEVAYWKDAGKLVESAAQAGTPRWIVAESTANGAQGWFYERCMEALDGNTDWTLHFYPWWWEDEYAIPLDPGEALAYTDDEGHLVDAHGLSPEQIKWRRAKQRELPHTFVQEYPEDPQSCFLLSGASYFGNVEHTFTAPDGARPVEDRYYVGGLDFAQTTDYTVLTILDALTRQQVDQLRINRLPWQEMRRQISVMANKWNAYVVGEANSMGSTNIELLQSGEIVPGRTEIAPINLDAFDTTPTSKPPLIQALYHALHEEGMTLLNRESTKHELRAFISRQTPSGHWVYEAGAGAHDDIVMALALANCGVMYGRAGVTFS